MFAHELLWIITLNVTTVVLVKVGEFVVKQHGGRDIEGDVELEDALGGGGVAGRRYESILGWCELGAGL